MDDTDAQGQSFWPDLEELARPARERRRLSPETRGQIIVRLCSRAPLSVKELSILLDRSEAYIGDAIRPLVNAGDLTFLYPDQPRHPRQKYVAAADSNGTAPAPAPVPPPYQKFAPRTPRPAPAPAPVSLPATAPAPVIKDPEQSADVTTGRAPRYPNPWTNAAFVIIVGLALGFWPQRNWFVFAAVAAVALSWWHVASESAQYRRFRALQPQRNRRTRFAVLKSAVALIEIALVYFFMLAYNGRL